MQYYTQGNVVLRDREWTIHVNDKLGTMCAAPDESSKRYYTKDLFQYREDRRRRSFFLVFLSTAISLRKTK